jgi:hypothetical protein
MLALLELSRTGKPTGHLAMPAGPGRSGPGSATGWRGTGCWLEILGLAEIYVGQNRRFSWLHGMLNPTSAILPSSCRAARTPTNAGHAGTGGSLPYTTGLMVLRAKPLNPDRRCQAAGVAVVWSGGSPPGTGDSSCSTGSKPYAPSSPLIPRRSSFDLSRPSSLPERG